MTAKWRGADGADGAVGRFRGRAEGAGERGGMEGLSGNRCAECRTFALYTPVAGRCLEQRRDRL